MPSGRRPRKSQWHGRHVHRCRSADEYRSGDCGRNQVIPEGVSEAVRRFHSHVRGLRQRSNSHRCDWARGTARQRPSPNAPRCHCPTRPNARIQGSHRHVHVRRQRRRNLPDDGDPGQQWKVGLPRNHRRHCPRVKRMVTIDDVRRYALTLPLSYEALVGGRVKFRVGRIVYVSFSRDETVMGFGFPKDQRNWLIGGSPDRFMLPTGSDLRYHWVRVRLAAIDETEMRELVLDAWRMVVPKSVAAASQEVQGSHQTSSEVQTKVLRLGQELVANGHDAGPETIAHHLIGQVDRAPSVATVWRILKRNGLITPSRTSACGPHSSGLKPSSPMRPGSWTRLPGNSPTPARSRSSTSLDDKSRVALASN